ncbi:hypothetical protein FB567DRAFT_24062 [Paraphoma chrysanthemicola]|uniref:EthD domain-containing protein n=1 Tax=Paraphoma chrysanthemicola TaxID=798071 RepID=A0A8K0RI53_9PLEO|nr:hypothetical protein FB567DRAFT_24062 [Paraphoma chrysanthemicola]
MAHNITSYPCPNHLIHQHVFPELSIGTGSNQQIYFRAMVFFNKKPGLTDEFFHAHWKTVHADLTMQVEGAGVELVRYVQFHQEKQHIEAMAPLLEASGGSMTIAPYEGAAEFHAESAEAFVRFMKNVYGSKHLVGCGTRFVDLIKGYHVMVGYDNLIFGAGIPGMGKDGLGRGDSRLNRAGNGVELRSHSACCMTSKGTEELLEVQQP